MRSSRRPWLRGGLLGPVPLLLPFIWVLETSSCGGTQTHEFTGLQLISKFDVEFWLLFVPPLVLCIALPIIAARLIVPLHRLWFHALGAAATLFTSYLALMVLFFALFSERHLRGVGWVVFAAFAGAAVDALARLVWSVQEWRAARKAPA